MRFRALTSNEDGSGETWTEYDLNLVPATEEAANIYIGATLDELNRASSKLNAQKRVLQRLEMGVALPSRKRAAG